MSDALVVFDASTGQVTRRDLTPDEEKLRKQYAADETQRQAARDAQDADTEDVLSKLATAAGVPVDRLKKAFKTGKPPKS